MKKQTPRTFLKILTGAALSLILICMGCQNHSKPDYWPTKEWRSSTPEEQGVSSTELAKSLDALISHEDIHIHSFLMIRNGYIISEYYAPGYDEQTLHNLHSATKSFTSTLIGIAEKKRFLSVKDFIHKEKITIEHLLTMSSALGGEPLTSIWDDETRNIYDEKNWENFLMNMETYGDPGKVFDYNSGNSHLLMCLLSHVVPDIREYINKELFQPLGIKDYIWAEDPQEIPVGGWGLHLRPRDMAKLGFLYLNDGRWEGKQILSHGWIKRATSDYFPQDDQNDYGYQFWLGEKGVYARGFGNQTIGFIPSDNVIIVFTAQAEPWQYNEPHNPADPVIYKFWESYPDIIISDTSLEEDLKGQKELQEVLLKHSVNEIIEQEIPREFLDLAGKELTYKIDKRWHQSLQLEEDFQCKILFSSISETEMTIKVTFIVSSQEKPVTTEFLIGLDNQYRINSSENLYPDTLSIKWAPYHYPNPENYRMALKGSFNDTDIKLKKNTSLLIESQIIGSVLASEWLFIIKDDDVQLSIKNYVGGITLISEY